MRLARGLLLVVSLIGASAPAWSETRVALIIGNSRYADASLRLENPANDALAMDKALREAGFETVVKLNASRLDFYDAVNQFKAKISHDPDAVGLFYYAGHGVQADGVNYLIPVDAKLESDSDLDARAYDAGRVLRAMEAAQNGMNIVILDACRDNPLPKSRGAERGLARMTAASGTFIAYAAAPGQVAHDGSKGSNGVFTGELVKAMSVPGMPLEQVFKRVIAGVKSDTKGSQQPWSESSIQGDFYFHAAAASTPVAHAVQSAAADDADVALWRSIESSRNAGDFRRYLDAYPHGLFAELARDRVKSLDVASSTARQPAHSTSPSATQAPVASTDKKCQSLIEQAQLGEINEETKKALEKCH
ncbi:MAG TPA: caspase family protein [Steroidobacteraceae bacterium]